jgi:type I restriction enzyme, S subunit
MNSRMYVPHKLFKIKDVGNVVTGITPSTKIEKYFNGTIPFVTPSELGKEAPIIKAATYLTDLGATQAKLVPKNAVLVCCIGSLGKVGFAGRELATNQQINTIVFNEEVVYPRYGYYVCRTLKPILINMASSTTIPIVNKTRFENLEIPLPPLEQQQRIAQVLDAVDSLLAKRREGLKKLEVLLKSVFLEMFGDPVTNPKGWSIQEIGEFCKVKGGLQITPARKDNPLEVPYLRVANVYRDQLNLTEIKTIRVTEAEFIRSKLEKNDLLLVEGHGNADEIGRSSVWDGSIEDCVHQNHLIRVQTDHQKCLPAYLSAFLNSSGGRKQLIQSGNTTSGLNTISANTVRGVKVLIPPLELQILYVKRQQNILKSRIQNIQNLSSLEKLFASLQHQAFNGTLTVGVLEREVQKLEEAQAVLF